MNHGVSRGRIAPKDRLVVAGRHCGGAGVLALAGAAGRDGGAPVHRAGVWVQRVQPTADAAGGHRAVEGRCGLDVAAGGLDLLDRADGAGVVGGDVWEVGGPSRPEVRDAGERGVLLRRVDGVGAGRSPAPPMADLPRVWGDRRDRAGAGLHRAGVHADEVVPGPAGARDGAGDHGLRGRCLGGRTVGAGADGAVPVADVDGG